MADIFNQGNNFWRDDDVPVKPLPEVDNSFLAKVGRVWGPGENSIWARSNRWLQTQREKPKSNFEQTLLDYGSQGQQIYETYVPEEAMANFGAETAAGWAMKAGLPQWAQVVASGGGAIVGGLAAGPDLGDFRHGVKGFKAVNTINKAKKAIRSQSTDLFDYLNRKVSGKKWGVLQEEGLEGTGRIQKGLNNEIIPNKQSVYYQQPFKI